MSAKKPIRPGLPSASEPIIVQGLPAADPAPARASTTPAPAPPVPPPAPYPGVRGYGQTRPAPRTGGRSGTRPDPPGMSRESYYITQAAAVAVADAITRVRAALGDSKNEVPKQVILSALLHAAAERADDVAARIAEQQADDLTARLAALRRTTG